MPPELSTPPLRVVVVGGGVAALEAVLALHDLAGERLAVTLVAPEAHFVLRSLAVAAPFSRGRVDQLPLRRVMEEHGWTFIRGAVERVDASTRRISLAGAADVPYDVLVLAHGAREVPAFGRALSFGEHAGDFSGLLADLEQGYCHSVAFVVPEGNTWPLPLYEVVLMTAQELWSMNMDRVELHLVTPEIAPLAVFGTAASAATDGLLAAAGIAVHLGVRANVTGGGDVRTGPDELLKVDRVVALPLLEGRRLEGVPADAQGFIAVDDAGQAHGLESVYAIGDVTDREIKQGGLACQQADVTAAHIARRAGAGVEVPPLAQVLSGRLLTGGADRFFRREPPARRGTASIRPLWWPPTKVSGKHLTPYLAGKDLVHLPVRADAPVDGVDVHQPVAGRRCVPGGVLVAAGPSDSAWPGGLRG